MDIVKGIVSQVPVLFIAFGLVLITGSFRGREGSFETEPVLGGGLLLVGVLLWVGLSVLTD